MGLGARYDRGGERQQEAGVRERESKLEYFATNHVNIKSLRGPYERETFAAVAAARAAGQLIMEASRSLKAIDVRQKGAHDLITDFDHAAQELIAKHLLGAFPHHQVVGEEGDAGKISTGEFVWIVDPIDGTTNFTRALPPFAVSIALEHAGEVVVGVVLDPTRDELFVATRGGGLFLNDEPARCSSTQTLDTALVATGFPYRSIDLLPEFLEVLREIIRRTHGFRRLGSAAIDLAYVAVGRVDAFYEAGLMAWDMAAGKLLVEEGGGRVTDFSGKSHALSQTEIVATNHHVHDELVSLLGPLSHPGSQVGSLKA